MFIECTTDDFSDLVNAAVEIAVARVHFQQLRTIQLGRVRRFCSLWLAKPRACAIAIKQLQGGRATAIGIACEVDGMFDGKVEGIAHTLYLSDRSDMEMATALVDEVERHAIRLGWHFLHTRLPFPRTAVHEVLSGRDEWTQSAVTICKELTARNVRLPRRKEGLVIRPATEDDSEALVEFYAWAFFDALAESERDQFSFEQVKESSRPMLEQFRSVPHLILISELDGEVVGHSTALLGVKNSFLGREECILHDTYVKHELRMQGIARILTAHMEVHVQRRGARLISGTACGVDDEELDFLLGNLARAGWLAVDRLWLRRLPTPSPRS